MNLSAQPRFKYAEATKNDFVMVDDPNGGLELNAYQVKDLAHRIGGGTDGVIRVLRTTVAAQLGFLAELSAAEQVAVQQSEWFMDYRNADGSLAQMCGNGLRAFGAFLTDLNYVDSTQFKVGTRAGLKEVEILQPGPFWRVKVSIGAVNVLGKRQVQIKGDNLGALWLEGFDINVGNPHTVVFLPDEIALDDLDLSSAPVLEPHPIEGTNVEFVKIKDETRISMRVYERGVGETLSCGTGATAAAAATAMKLAAPTKAWVVEVPGGELEISIGEIARLTGLATLRELKPDDNNSQRARA